VTGPGATPLPEAAEVVVVGAGIVGAFTALYLARDGREALLLDRAEPWNDASGANAGTLSLQVKTPAAWDMTRLALRLWAQLDAELDGGLGFTRCGGLRVALDEREHSRLVGAVARQRESGLDVRMLQGEALREEAPWLGPEVVSAGLCPDDAYASPLLAGPALIAATAASGVAVTGGCAVTRLERAGDGFLVHTGHGAVRCAVLVLAAGAWTGELAAGLGLTLPVLADVNMLHVTEAAPALMHRIITHIGGVLSLKQYANGTCMIGGGWQGRGSLASGRRDTDHENLHHNLAVAARVVPALADLRLVRSWTGFEALVPDALPLVGEVDSHPGLYLAACARGGYTLGPAQAFIVRELMAGRAPPLAIAPFAPARLAA
jgi:glycine/D-amino acid oxidase-like deaminating enzyme